MFIIHIYYMHVCLRWLSQTIEDLVPQEREGGARMSSGEKTSVMRLKQNAKTNRRGRAEKDRERERESLESVIPAVHIFAPTAVLVFSDLFHLF